MSKSQTRLRAYKPIRFLNPGTATAHLSPGQGLRLLFNGPQGFYENVSDDASYQVRFNSDSFFLSSTEVDGRGRVVFNVEQKYDLSEWAAVGRVFLGEVTVDIANNVHPESGGCPFKPAVIQCYLEANLPARHGRHKVVTVINPVVTAGSSPAMTVKVGPDEVLEVVCSEPGWSGDHDEWDVAMKDVNFDGHGVCVRPIHQFSHQSDAYSGSVLANFIVLSRSAPPLNPRLPEDKRANLARQATLTGRPAKEHHFWFAFDRKSLRNVRSFKHGDHEVARLTLTGTCPPYRSARRELAVSLWLHGRPESKVEPMFNTVTAKLNASAEVMSRDAAMRRVLDSAQGLLVNPGPTDNIAFQAGINTFYVEIAAPPEYWPSEPESAQWDLKCERVGPEDIISVERMGSLSRHGLKFYSFRINRRTPITMGTISEKYLGTIVFTYTPKQHAHEAVRRVTCWMKGTTPPAFIHQPACRNDSFKVTSVGYNGILKLADVHFAELTSDALSSHATTLRMKDIRVSPPLRPCDNGVRRHHHPHVVYGPPAASLKAGGREPPIIYDPTHLQEVVLSDPNRELVIRLSPPSEVLDRSEDRDRCRGELWAVTPLGPGDCRPLVDRHRIAEVATDRYRQEVRIVVRDRDLPAEAGRYSCGMLRLESTGGVRVVKLFVEKGASDRAPATPFTVDLATPPLTHEANGRLYLFCKDWKSGQSVLVRPSDVVYVENPPLPPEWVNTDWSVRLEQHAIPNEVWEKVSDEVKKIVDPRRAWFAQDCPFRLNRTMYLKPLELSSVTCLPQLLADMRRITHAYHWPVATLHYESHRSDFTKLGDDDLETVQRLTRRLTICVRLAESPMDPVSVYPKNNDVIRAAIGSVVHVNLTEEGPVAWSCIAYPACLQYFSQWTKGGITTFCYTVGSLGTGLLKFRSEKACLELVFEAIRRS